MASTGIIEDGRHAGLLRRLYFPVASVLLLLLTLIGFSDNLLTDVGQRSNRDLKFVVHGLFCLAWMLVFAVQANLVRVRNIRVHRQLGTAAMVIAAGTALSTLYVFIAVWKGWDRMHVYGQANRLLLPCFVLLVILGYLNRRRPDRHKRLLYLATLFMMEPVLSRALDPFIPFWGDMPEAEIDRIWLVFFLLVWNGFFLSLFAYDRIVDRRVHPVTGYGYLACGAIWTTVWLV